ncbi:hypothetical protein [Bacillus cereus]|uniref:hypothetical protein n=1 Tax=Bacillus cereus TaxID=1396 RepID=UPI001C8CA390|nr:hypothetical protein [Bacillus cereus]MBX9158621.1 hypothetical protein [Bacillus cereus]
MEYNLNEVHKKAIRILMKPNPKFRDGHPGYTFSGELGIAVRQLTKMGLVERVQNLPTGGMLYLTRQGKVVGNTFKYEHMLKGLQVSDAQKKVLYKLNHAYHRPHPIEEYNKRTVQSLLNKKLIERYPCEGCPKGAVRLTGVGLNVLRALG